ncbi:MAG: hypothetical protein ACKVOK_06120 [Flavobacteriales bacterium]
MKIHFLKTILLALALIQIQSCFAEFRDTTSKDTTKSRVAYASKFGLNFGFNYSFLRLESNPYFLEDGNGFGEATAVNSPGMNAGMFWHEPLKEKTSIRFGIEASIMFNMIEYETGRLNKDRSQVFPLTIELPVSFIFGRHFRYDVEAKSLRKSGVMAGLRPVFPVPAFNSSQPVLKSFNLNIDVGVSKPVALKKSIMRTELFFSYGLLNMIGKDETDYKTKSIEYLGRSFVGLRMYFN